MGLIIGLSLQVTERRAVGLTKVYGDHDRGQGLSRWVAIIPIELLSLLPTQSLWKLRIEQVHLVISATQVDK